MELSLSWGANTHLSSQEIPCFLRTTNVQYRVHRSLPSIHTCSHISLVHTLPFYVSLRLHFSIIRSYTPTSPSSLFVSGLLTKIYRKNSLFWNVTPHSLLKFSRRLGGTCRLHLQSRVALLATSFRLVSCLAYSSVVKIEATCFFEASMDF
jgi:hypothetical protein